MAQIDPLIIIQDCKKQGVGADKILANAKKHLRAGADPNAVRRDWNEFESALGLAAEAGYGSVVKLLLQAGAGVHWPEENVPQEELSGDAEDPYTGLSLDPLGAVMDTFAWTVAEHELRKWGSHFEESLGGYISCTNQLLDAGADPFRDDPGTGRMPTWPCLRGLDWAETHQPQRLPWLFIATLILFHYKPRRYWAYDS
jgi:hypothetical protein